MMELNFLVKEILSEWSGGRSGLDDDVGLGNLKRIFFNGYKLNEKRLLVGLVK